KANPRELLQLKNSLTHVLALTQIPIEDKIECPALLSLIQSILSPQEVIQLIQSTIQEEAPVLLSKGDVIQPGVHQELDELRNLRRDSKTILLNIQVRESERTGIPSLK